MPHPYADDILSQEPYEEMSDDELQRRRVEQSQGGDPQTPPTECTSCGGHGTDHASDCEAMLELEKWALNEKTHREQYRAEKKPLGGIRRLDFEDDEVEEIDEESSSSQPMEVDDDLLADPLPERLDLSWFFAQYGVDPLGQIAVCRTHANNLAALNRVMKDGSTGARPVGRPTKKGKKE